MLGLVASIALAHGSILKALAMIVLGLLLGMVGQDIYTGTPRFTFGFFELYSGINFVSVAVGVFGVAEILRNLENESDPRRCWSSGSSNLWLTREEFRRIAAPVLRGTALGSVLGVLPGGGHVLASFASYSIEKRLSKTPEEFGQGAIEGVAAPESANNAAAQTSFIPLLTLGIPAHPVMALMIGAFIIQGITPGPNVIRDEPALFWGIIVSMWVGNLMLVLLNLPLIGLWVQAADDPLPGALPGDHRLRLHRLLRDQPERLRRLRDRGLRRCSATCWCELGCEPAPLLLGFVLGPLLEEHLRRAMIISRGDPMIFVTRPISATLLALAALALVLSRCCRRSAQARRGVRRGGLMGGAGQPTMLRRVPGPQLRPFVSAIVGYEEHGAAMAQVETASLDVPVIITLAGSFRIALDRPPDAADRLTSFAAGLHPGFVAMASDGAAACVQINFTPLGARLALGLPMHELASRMVPLDDLPGTGLGELARPARRLPATGTGGWRSPKPGRLRARRDVTPDPGVAAALRTLGRTGGSRRASRRSPIASAGAASASSPAFARRSACRRRRSPASCASARPSGWPRPAGRTGPTSPPPAATATSRIWSASSARSPAPRPPPGPLRRAERPRNKSSRPGAGPGCTLRAPPIRRRPQCRRAKPRASSPPCATATRPR